MSGEAFSGMVVDDVDDLVLFHQAHGDFIRISTSGRMSEQCRRHWSLDSRGRRVSVSCLREWGRTRAWRSDRSHVIPNR